MRAIVSNLLVIAMAVTYFLLAVQAEPITAFFGYLFGGLLVVAVIAATTKLGKKANAGES